MFKNQLSGEKNKDYFMTYASFHGVITAPVAPSVTGYRTRRSCLLAYSIDPTQADHREQTDSVTMAENKSVKWQSGKGLPKKTECHQTWQMSRYKWAKEAEGLWVRKEGEGEWKQSWEESGTGRCRAEKRQRAEDPAAAVDKFQSWFLCRGLHDTHPMV